MNQHCDACDTPVRYLVDTQQRYEVIDAQEVNGEPSPIRLRICLRCAVALGEIELIKVT